MHNSAYRIGELVMHTYSDLPAASILEIGSMNVNGCLRDAASPTTHYVGLDLEEGPSVDIVIQQDTDWPVADDSFDLVIASSVFEHDPRFWQTFLRMCRAAKPGGYVYVNAPSNGMVHRYPQDCWRFYPDAGLALADHARREGIEVELVESFVARQQTDFWNDFAAVFRKGPCVEPFPASFVHQLYPSMNVLTWQSVGDRAGNDTQDMEIIAGLTGERDALIHERNTWNLGKEVEMLRGQLRREVLARQDHLEWLAKVHQAMDAGEGDLDQLFNAQDYLSRHPDVASLGMDPLRHYLLYGIAEKRELAPAG